MPAKRRPPSVETDGLVAFLAAEGVDPGARILDVPCGIGRRALELARRGFRVEAVDKNEVAIEALRRRVSKNLADRLTYRAVPEDELPGRTPSNPADVILCVDHALSREPPVDDRGFLRRLRDHVKPSGFALVEFLNRDFFAARPRPFAYHVIGNLEQHEFRAFDAVSGILDLRWTFYQQKGDDLEFRGESSVRLKLLVPHEARELVEDGGWSVESVYGGWARETMTADRRQFVLVARPAARD